MRLKNFKRSFESAVTRAKLKDVVIHDLRRTFRSNCVMNRSSLPSVQAWRGHSSIETTIKHYGHLTQSYRKEEIRKIEGRMDTYQTIWKKVNSISMKIKEKSGAPCMIRTCGPRFRKPVLYPTELRGQ